MDYLKILASIKQKEQSGIECLYTKYGAKLYGYAIINWNLTEDESWELVYKTLLKIVEVVDRYEFKSDRHFQNWIFKIFKNELLQYLRKLGSRTTEKEFLSIESLNGELNICDSEWETIIDGIRLMDDKSIDELLNNEKSVNPSIIALEKALDQMGDLDKQLLLLRAQGFNYEEIAGFMGLGSKNLKVKHLRAKQKLLKLFGSFINN